MPILLLLGTGIVALATNATMANLAWTDKDLTPRIQEWDARKIGIGLGIVGMLVGGPIIGSIGTGVALGTLLSAQNLNMFKDAILDWKRTHPDTTQRAITTDAPEQPGRGLKDVANIARQIVDAAPNPGGAPGPEEPAVQGLLSY